MLVFNSFYVSHKLPVASSRSRSLIPKYIAEFLTELHLRKSWERYKLCDHIDTTFISSSMEYVISKDSFKTCFAYVSEKSNCCRWGSQVECFFNMML